MTNSRWIFNGWYLNLLVLGWALTNTTFFPSRKQCESCCKRYFDSITHRGQPCAVLLCFNRKSCLYLFVLSESKVVSIKINKLFILSRPIIVFAVIVICWKHYFSSRIFQWRVLLWSCCFTWIFNTQIKSSQSAFIVRVHLLWECSADSWPVLGIDMWS